MEWNNSSTLISSHCKCKELGIDVLVHHIPVLFSDSVSSKRFCDETHGHCCSKTDHLSDSRKDLFIVFTIRQIEMRLFTSIIDTISSPSPRLPLTAKLFFRPFPNAGLSVLHSRFSLGFMLLSTSCLFDQVTQAHFIFVALKAQCGPLAVPSTQCSRSSSCFTSWIYFWKTSLSR